MKKICLSLVFISYIVFAASSALAQKSDCKYCSNNGVTFFCVKTDVQHQVGGCTCTSGITCQLDNPCSPRFPCTGPLAATQNESPIIFDEKTIKDIAQLYPRMAVSLITLNNNGGLKGRSVIFSPAAEINPSEVFNFQNPNKEDLTSKNPFFEEFAKRLDTNQEPPSISFGFSKRDNLDGEIVGSVMQSFSKDPKYKGIVIRIVDGKVASWSLEESEDK